MNLKDKLNKDEIEKAFNSVKTAMSENTNLIRNKMSKTAQLIRDKMDRKIMLGIGAGVLGVAVLSTALIVTMGTDVYQVSIDGKSIGYVENREIVDETIQDAKAELIKKNKGLEIVEDKEMIACIPTDLSKRKVTFLSEKQLEDTILKSDMMKAKAWAIRINDQNLLATATKENADAVLDGVKKHFQTAGSQIVEANFKEPVLVTKAAVNLKSIMTQEEGISYMVTGTKGKKPYIVQDGDTCWDIAIENGMTFDELAAANAGSDLWKLKIGTELSLVVAKPYVTVVLKEIVATTQEIDFQTTYQNTNTMYAGQVKVKNAGVKGTKEIKSEIIKENGVEIAKTELETKVIAEPQNAVALKGTKAIVGYAGKSSGVYGSPMSKLQVSSGFGNRGGARHLGIDFRNPCGTPIYATESGKVTFSSYSGSYGNLVKISHGGGVETLYAHCNSLLVSAGQTVSKGQQIATVGATGNATGYHLHFEVRVNGVAQNPWNYI